MKKMERIFLETGPKQLDISHYFLFMLIFAGCYLCYGMMQVYLDPILFALILSSITSPVYASIQKRVKGNQTLAALIACFLLTFVIVIPFLLILIAGVKQGITTTSAINQWVSTLDMEEIKTLPWVSNILIQARQYLPEDAIAELDLFGILQSFSANAGKLVVSNGTRIISNISTILINFSLMIFVYFFGVQKQKELFAYVFHLMPLSHEYEEILVEKIKAVAKSALLGTLVTSAAQGLAGGIGFAICGLPGFFWGAVMAFASLIPLVGTALIWIPGAGYLFFTGHYLLGGFLVIWSVLVVGMIDNLVRPLFMKESSGMGILVIFFSILGGLNLFGLTGLLYGPLIFGITLVLFYIYDLEFNAFLNGQDQNNLPKPEKETP